MLPQQIGQHPVLWEDEKTDGTVPLMMLLRRTLHFIYAGQVELLWQVGGHGQTGRFPQGMKT